MNEVGFWAIPREGTPERDRLFKEIEKHKNDPQFKKIIKKNFQYATSLIDIQKDNGTGFPLDQQIREYNIEYNNRVFNYTLHDMPGSFNIMEAFNKFYPPAGTFHIREEKDHLFSFTDFIDFITSNEDTDDISSIINYTKDGVIYSYNSVSNPQDITFSTSNGKNYGIIGVSLIRFANEVSILMLAGEECDLQLKTSELQDIKISKPSSHKAHIKIDHEKEVKAEPVIEGLDLWKTILLMRIDLKSKTIDARYVYQDIGSSYTGFTDDIYNYLDQNRQFISPEVEEAFKNSSSKLDEYMPLIEVGKLALTLPKFFHERDDDIKIERHLTEYGKNRNKIKYQKISKVIESKYKISSRLVYCLAEQAKNSPSNVGLLAPEIKIETTGYWQRLMPQEIGRDKEGQPIHGRTWVQKTLSWVVESAETLYATKKTRNHKANHPGFIYVMRSAAHEKDIFKVGLTQRDSDIRAAELSRTTSSPDHFLVVEDWEVSDCVLAEKLIHQELDQYRVNPKREFFRARYSIIHAAINKILETLENTA